MPKGEQRGNREAKKPKKEKAKASAAAPSTKGSVGATVALQGRVETLETLLHARRREFIAVLVSLGHGCSGASEAAPPSVLKPRIASI